MPCETCHIFRQFLNFILVLHRIYEIKSLCMNGCLSQIPLQKSWIKPMPIIENKLKFIILYNILTVNYLNDAIFHIYFHIRLFEPFNFQNTDPNLYKIYKLRNSCFYLFYFICASIDLFLSILYLKHYYDSFKTLSNSIIALFYLKYFYRTLLSI